MRTLSLINTIIAILFTVCCAYQFCYIPVVWFRRRRRKPSGGRLHSYAVLICARNEAEVIADLIESVKGQTYPSELVHIFVLADNCDDDTAAIARGAGAVVYERFDHVRVGKGYALNALMQHLREDYPTGFDGYFVFDADNILAADYIEQMNRTFSEGHDIVTGYRNSKNYGSNWISAGYALWFLRESRYLNHARHLIGSSCAVSGTGFLFSRAVAEEMDGWPFHTLTEDIEFSAEQITSGRKIAFCADAELYDEQPVTFIQSWHQRMRWAKGYLQVFRIYGADLLRQALRGDFSCFDMSMTIMPAFILSAISIISNITLGIWGACTGDDVMIAVRSIGGVLGNMYLILFVIGLITTVTERSHIHTSPARMILYTFTFPLFMFTYIPISFTALFVKTSWRPIRHTYSVKSMSARGVRLLTGAVIRR